MRNFFEWLKYNSGIFSYTDPKGEHHRGKTLWDLLQLLIIPLFLAGAAIWFNQDRTREDSLQSYLDEMEHLLIDEKLRTSSPDAEVRSGIYIYIIKDKDCIVMRFLFANFQIVKCSFHVVVPIKENIVQTWQLL